MKKLAATLNSKKRTSRIFGFLICILFMIIPVFLSAESLSCDLSAGGYRLVKTASGEIKIEMDSVNYGRLNSPGDPMLPEKIIELKVPEDGVISNLELTVDGVDVKALPMAYDMVPEGPSLLGAREYWGEGKSIVKGKNVRVYGMDTFFPAKQIELLPAVTKKELAGMDGKRRIFRLVRYIRLAFRPFAYNPVSRQLKLNTSASVTISYNVAAMAKISLKADPAVAADYVIITTNAIVNNSTMLQSFVKMKEAAGHTVRIVTEDDFDSLTGQAPNGRAEKIRQWLMDNYLALGIDYILLIGNPDPDDPLDDTRDDIIGDIPMKMCYPRFCNADEREYPTDYFYKDLVGNWDLDGDLLFGETLAVDHAKSPSPLIEPDTFSARWTGKVQIDYTDNYLIGTMADDGVRVYLDGNPVPLIDDWTDHTTAVWNAQFYSTTSVGLHDITVEYYQNTGDAMVQLYWRSIGHIENNTVIPADHLYHYDSATGGYVAGGLSVSYYNSIDLSGIPATTGVDIINNAWLTGDDGPGGRQPEAMVSVGRIPVYNSSLFLLDNILIKIINYETDPGDISWRRSILLPMKPTDETHFGYDLAEPVKADIADPLGFSSFRIYEEDYAPTGPTPDLWPCTIENVVGEWQKYYGMVTWYGHGWSDLTDGIMDLGHVDELDDRYPSMTFQGSCSNGYPEEYDNLGYSLLKNGCVATVSASRMVGGGRYTGDIRADNVPNLAYFFISYLLDNGGAPLAMGDALKKTQNNMDYVGIGSMAFNLYGDPDCYLLTTNPHPRPVAEAGGPYHCIEGEGVVLDATGSYDPSGGAIEYRWDTRDDGIFNTEWSSDPTCTIDRCIETTIISVQVRNEIGCVSWDSACITVDNIPPTVEAGPDQVATISEPVSFSGSASDPGNDVDTWEWDFGDGTPVETGTLFPTHTFAAIGIYTVTLTVWDRNGGVGSDTLQVRVFDISPLSNENPARPWTKIQGNFSLTNDTAIMSEGTLSLRMGGSGYMVAGTTVFTSSELAGYSNQLSLDIYMPSPATNPYWLGQVQLFVNCPSAGINNQPVAQVNLTGMPLDTWNTIEFALPQYIVNLFSGSHNDIQIRVAVNTNQSAGNPYRIDALRFTGDIVIPPPAPEANRLENVWSATTTTATYLTQNSANENSAISCQTLHTDWASQEWILEPVSGYSDRVRLKCLWNNGSTYYYLTATGTSGAGNGDPVVGKALHTDWASQIWIKEAGRDGSTRLKSAWSMSTYLTVKTADSFSAVVCQPNHPEWSSQEWNIK